MDEGRLTFSFNCGTGPAIMKSPKPYNDGNWHTVMVHLNVFVIISLNSQTFTTFGPLLLNPNLNYLMFAILFAAKFSFLSL